MNDDDKEEITILLAMICSLIFELFAINRKFMMKDMKTITLINVINFN